MKTTYRKICVGNLLMWSDLTLGPSFKVKRLCPNLKVPISSLLLLPEVWDVKLTLNSTFVLLGGRSYHCSGLVSKAKWPPYHPFFNVKWGHLATEALYLPLFSIITDPKAGNNHCVSILLSLYLHYPYVMFWENKTAKPL